MLSWPKVISARILSDVFILGLQRFLLLQRFWIQRDFAPRPCHFCRNYPNRPAVDQIWAFFIEAGSCISLARKNRPCPCYTPDSEKLCLSIARQWERHCSRICRTTKSRRL